MHTWPFEFFGNNAGGGGGGGGTSYIKSIQQVAITIGSGATSNTGTISSVTAANAVIIQNGQTGNSNTTDYSKTLTRSTLTNSTTVTVQRNTSDTNTITVYLTVLEFQPSAIVSNQSGSITLGSGQTSNTATLGTSVTTAHAVCFFNGNTSAASGDNFAARDLGNVTLTNSTTVTAARGVNPTTSLTVNYTVVEFASAVLQSIQQFSVGLTSGNTSDTQAISSVTTGNACIIYGGTILNTTNLNNTADIAYYLQLTNATTVTMTRGGTNSSGTRTINFTVLEFASGVLNSSVQRGTVSLTSQTSNDATLSSISTAKGFINYVGYAQNIAQSPQADLFAANELFSATDVRALLGASSATASVVGYEAVEFK